MRYATEKNIFDTSDMAKNAAATDSYE